MSKEQTAPDLSSITLLSGSHASRADGVCALELVAWLAGEPHTDHPVCCSPVLGAFFRCWNDTIAPAARTRIILPFVPRLVGSVSTPTVETARSYLALDWLIRVHAPAWLALRADLKDHANTLRGLDPINNHAGVLTARPKVRAARDAAGAAAEAAAGAAAWIATGDAVSATAWIATGDAVRATAGAAARAAAWIATGDAAATNAVAIAAEDAVRDAAWIASGAATNAVALAASPVVLAPTVAALQRSAADLVERMLALGVA